MGGLLKIDKALLAENRFRSVAMFSHYYCAAGVLFLGLLGFLVLSFASPVCLLTCFGAIPVICVACIIICRVGDFLFQFFVFDAIHFLVYMLGSS